jgi:hypothetical protein
MIFLFFVVDDRIFLPHHKKMRTETNQWVMVLVEMEREVYERVCGSIPAGLPPVFAIDDSTEVMEPRLPPRSEYASLISPQYIGDDAETEVEGDYQWRGPAVVVVRGADRSVEEIVTKRS